MNATFEDLIRKNKRDSVLLVAILGSFVVLFFGVLFSLFGDDSDFLHLFSLGSFIGGILAIIGAFTSYFAGAWIITAINDTREIVKPDDPELFNVVEEMAIAGGIPAPKVHIIEDESPNAFATGRDPKHGVVGITTGLRKKLTRDELQAVMAHEIAHIKNYDIRLMMLVAVFAGIIVIAADLLRRRFYGVARFKRRGSASLGGRKGNPAVAVVVIIAAIMLAWLAPIIAKLIQLSVSREREYLADATAVQLCRNPLALAGALEKIAKDPAILSAQNRATEHLFIINPRESQKMINFSKDSIWSTHPPVIKRIEKLKRLAKEEWALLGSNQ